MVGKSSPGSINPDPANTSSSYTFNAEIEIMDSNYEFVSLPEYELTEGSGSFQTGATNFTGSVSSVYPPAQAVTQKIKAGYALKQFTYGLTTTNSLIDSNGVTGGGNTVEYSLSLSATSSGTYNINTNITGTWTATNIAPYQFTTGDPYSRTAVVSGGALPFTLTGNSTRTLTLTGTLEDTTILSQYRQLNATAVMNTAMVGSALQLYTLSYDVQNTSGASGTHNYTVPTVVPDTGYYLTGGVVILAVNPITFNSTTGQSGTGTAGDPIIESNPSVSLGNIYISTATVTVNCTATPRAATIAYITTFSSTITTGINLTTLSPSSTATSAFFYTGDGDATVSVSRTSPSNTSQGPGTIVWSLNGVQEFSESFTSLTAINYAKVIPGVAHGDTILVTISELGQFRQLIATTPMNTAMGAATQYTLSNNVQSISTSGNNDTTKTYTTPTIIPDVGYELTGGVVSLSSIGSNGTVTYFTSVWGTAGASNDGSGETLGDPAIENAVSVTTGTLATETRKLDPAAYIATQITGTAYTLTNGASQTINSAGLTTYTYLIPVVVPDTGYTLTGGLVSLPYNPITFFVTGSQSGTGTALDPLIENDPTVTAGTLTTTKATVEVNCVAVPVTTAITYVTTFAPGGGFPTRTLTTTGTQFLQNTAYAIGDGNITIQVTRTAPSGTAQDGGSIIWILNGVTQSTQTFSNGATISYSRSLVAAEGDTIKVEISEG